MEDGRDGYGGQFGFPLSELNDAAVLERHLGFGNEMIGMVIEVGLKPYESNLWYYSSYGSSEVSCLPSRCESLR